MILNPVIQGGGAEKEYKITNTSQIGFPTSAKASTFVFGLGNPSQKFAIHADNYSLEFPDVPHGEGDFPIPSGVSSRIPQATYYFIMPASDVTIK
jgi:hypothetical protein